MLKIKRADFMKIHPDYRGRIAVDSQNALAPDNGKWGALSGALGLPLGRLAVEGRDFEIIHPPRAKRRARKILHP